MPASPDIEGGVTRCNIFDISHQPIATLHLLAPKLVFVVPRVDLILARLSALLREQLEEVVAELSLELEGLALDAARGSCQVRVGYQVAQFIL